MLINMPTNTCAFAGIFQQCTIFKHVAFHLQGSKFYKTRSILKIANPSLNIQNFTFKGQVYSTQQLNQVGSSIMQKLQQLPLQLPSQTTIFTHAPIFTQKSKLSKVRCIWKITYPSLSIPNISFKFQVSKSQLQNQNTASIRKNSQLPLKVLVHVKFV